MDERAEVSGSEDESPAADRRLVEIRCGFAELAQREAELADARVADVLRRLDAQGAVVSEVAAVADESTTHSAKEHAHQMFRQAVTAARDRSAVEAAAHSWLAEINRTNGRLQSARTRLRRERQTTDALLAERERLTTTAEAARTMAEAARQACLEAREGRAVADDSDEEQAAAVAQSTGSAAAVSGVPGAAAVGVAAAASAAAAGGTPAAPSLCFDQHANPPQPITRLLARDRATLGWLVEQLAGPDRDAQSARTLQLSNLVDALIAAAIDEAWFDFPPGNPFWDQFTAQETREVARGLAALGYRYDGFGSFLDDRIPDQRDLALAIGGAGLYPVRIRHWPKPGEAALLFAHVRVAAGPFLAAKASGFTLGELVVALGRRAEMLADLWNDWDRVRPLLLANLAD